MFSDTVRVFQGTETAEKEEVSREQRAEIRKQKTVGAHNVRPEFVEKLIWGRRGRRPLQNFSRIIDKL